MATLIADLAGETSNSYVADLTRAKSLAARLKRLRFYGVDTSGWDVTPDEDLIETLILAAERIDQAQHKGLKQTNIQMRQYPRLSLERVQDERVVPESMELAQVAEACALLAVPDQNRTLQDQGVQSFTIAKKSVTFGASASVASSPNVSTAADRIMRGAGLLVGRVSSMHISRS